MKLANVPVEFSVLNTRNSVASGLPMELVMPDCSSHAISQEGASRYWQTPYMPSNSTPHEKVERMTLRCRGYSFQKRNRWKPNSGGRTQVRRLNVAGRIPAFAMPIRYPYKMPDRQSR